MPATLKSQPVKSAKRATQAKEADAVSRTPSRTRSFADTRPASDERLFLRASAELKERLAHAAVLQHQTITEFVLAASRDAANRILGEQTRFALSTEEMKKFESALEAPARDLPALRRLMNRKSVLG